MHSFIFSLLFLLGGVVRFITSTFYSNEARLLSDLVSRSNPEVRPPPSSNGITEVKFGMNLIQIMGISEKLQEMTTTLYLELTWQDRRLQWNISEYENIETIRIPVRNIWIPDVILENSKNNNMEISALKVNAVINYNGTVSWLPPSIHTTSCAVDVSSFPFDWQNCSLIYRSASLDTSQMKFGFHDNYQDKIKVDKNAFMPNGEWDLIQRPVKIYIQRMNHYKFQTISFSLVLRRKSQFYVLNMLFPCLVLTILSCFAFHLPVIAGEKITFSISLLLGQTIFGFLYAQKLPPIAAVPFAQSFLLFSIILLTISIACCVFVSNLHYRQPSTREPPKWLKVLFKFVGPLLGVNHTKKKWFYSHKNFTSEESSFIDNPNPIISNQIISNRNLSKQDHEFLYKKPKANPPNPVVINEQEINFKLRPFYTSATARKSHDYNIQNLLIPVKTIPRRFMKHLQNIRLIKKHIYMKKLYEMVKDDWAVAAMILDRLLMWLYLFCFIFGTLCYYVSISNHRYPEVDPQL